MVRIIVGIYDIDCRIMPGGIKVAQAFSAWGVVVFLVLSVAALL
jgi:hypothetical protein